MNRFAKHLAAVVAFFVVCGVAPVKAATFLVSRTIGTGSVNGTITTDGTTGVLGQANILDYNLSLKDSKGLKIITKGAGYVQIGGNALTATNDGLFFNMSASFGFAYFSSNEATEQAFYCLQINQCYDFGGPGEGVDTRHTGIASATAIRQTGVVQFASAQVSQVPEAATWAMMLIGFGGIGASMRRRKQTARIQFA